MARILKFVLAGVLVLVIIGLFVLLSFLQNAHKAQKVHDFIWSSRHDMLAYEAKHIPINLMFFGDSITQGWEVAGAAVWQRDYAPLLAGNFGVSGDTWENVLWRIQHGELKGAHPRLIVLLIGTNDLSHGHHVSQIVDGVTTVVNTMRETLPKTKILVLGIFPRGHEANSPFRKPIEEINEKLIGLGDDKNVFFLNINKNFLDAQGRIPWDVMPDELHLSSKGYEIWATSMNPFLMKLFGS